MSIEGLHNRIDLVNIPFTDRGSRLMVFRQGHKFSIKLAERWVRWEEEVGHYRQRPPIVAEITFLSAANEPLSSIQVDTYPHCIRVQTACGVFVWTFIDPETLLISLPAGRHGFEFEVHAQQSQTDYRGGTTHGKRNMAYTTNARLLQNTIEPREEGRFHVHAMLEADPEDALLVNITPRLAFNRSIPPPAAAIAASYAQWDAWFSQTPPVLEKYRQQYDYAWWILRSGLVSPRYYFTREALLPSKIHYVGVWHWDQVFHALAYRHVDIRLAEDQLRIVLDHQRADGMLPDAIHDEGLITRLDQPVAGEVTKPPIMSWAVLKLFEASGHYDFLEEVYGPLTLWNQWWFDANRDASGLYAYSHPFSSGLDDSPLWDEGMPVISPDLNTYLVLQQESLARIARIIGEHEAAKLFEQSADELLGRMIAELWDEDLGIFRARHNGKTVRALTPFNLLPLLTGKLPQAMCKRLLDHLTDPQLFWAKFPLSTVAMSDPAFDPEQMWRGPTWLNINYFFVEALKRIGEPQLGARLRQKTLALVMGHKDIYEYYNPLNGAHPPKAAPMFGWSAALFIELALDETAWQRQRPASKRRKNGTAQNNGAAE